MAASVMADEFAWARGLADGSRLGLGGTGGLLGLGECCCCCWGASRAGPVPPPPLPGTFVCRVDSSQPEFVQSRDGYLIASS